MELQSCDVFRGIYECARAAYLLFQVRTQCLCPALLPGPSGLQWVPTHAVPWPSDSVSERASSCSSRLAHPFIKSGYRPSASHLPARTSPSHSRRPLTPSPSPCPPLQHHTTPRRAPHDALLVTPQGGLHRLVALGPRQLLLLPDQRGERTRWADEGVG